MNKEDKDKKNQESFSVFIKPLMKNWKRNFFLFLALLLTIIFIWFYRYDQGYNQGANQGADYKQLFENAQLEVQGFQDQHDKDLEEITRLNKKVGRLEENSKIFSSTVSDMNAKELMDQAERKQVEIDKQQSEVFAKSLEVGKIIGRMEEVQKRNKELVDGTSQLQEKVDNQQFGIYLLFIILAPSAAFNVFFYQTYKKDSTEKSGQVKNNEKVFTSAKVEETSSTLDSLNGNSINQLTLPFSSQEGDIENRD